MATAAAATSRHENGNNFEKIKGIKCCLADRTDSDVRHGDAGGSTDHPFRAGTHQTQPTETGRFIAMRIADGDKLAMQTLAD